MPKLSKADQPAVVAWGDGEESWSVGYHVLYGDTGQSDIWSDLDRVLLRQWHHESRLELPITAVRGRRFRDGPGA